MLRPCDNQIFMSGRMKNKPQLPARFHEVSCLFKRWARADVADEGQMWIAAAQTPSSTQTERVPALFRDSN